jgi:hypothetical protein
MKININHIHPTATAELKGDVIIVNPEGDILAGQKLFDQAKAAGAELVEVEVYSIPLKKVFQK